MLEEEEEEEEEEKKKGLQVEDTAEETWYLARRGLKRGSSMPPGGCRVQEGGGVRSRIISP
jgi:hypothetical protein